jgi:class 3 adenylate cyclase
MTFRARLQQTILGIVAATTAAVLVVAQRQNSASFDAMVDTLFRQQSASFQRDQQAQTEAARFQASLGDSVRVFAALEEGDPETYNVVSDEVRLGGFDFFRLASAEAGLLDPPENSRAGVLASAQQQALHAQIGSALQAIDKESATVHHGFLTLPGEDGTEAALYRVLALPVRKFETTAGLLFLGQKVSVLPSHDDAQEGARLLPFILVNGKAHGEGPDAVRSHLSTHEIPSHEAAALRIDGQDFRVNHHLLNPGSAFPPATLVSLFPLHGFQQQQRSLQRRVLGIGVLALALSSLAASLIAKRLTRPIQELVAATQAVRDGRLDTRLPPGSTDEFARLTESFNEMTEGLALKERYHSVLSMVTDAKVAEQLMAGKIQLGGEAREVSILFCDIRGYTAMSVGRDPAEVIALLNQHMGALTEVVYRWQGVITQFAGDAIMAVFGAPTSAGDDAIHAVRCGWELLAARARLNEGSPLPLEIGIGIASGSVVAGCIGAENRADYTVVGERVNLAARLCSVAAAGQLVIDETTRAALPAGIDLEPMPAPLKLKGFEGGTIAYRVTAIHLPPPA